MHLLNCAVFAPRHTVPHVSCIKCILLFRFIVAVPSCSLVAKRLIIKKFLVLVPFCVRVESQKMAPASIFQRGVGEGKGGKGLSAFFVFLFLPYIPHKNK